MAFGCSPYHRVLTCYALVVNITTQAAAVDSSLQLRIFAQTLGMASPFKLPSQCKTCSPPPPFLQANKIGQYGIQRSILAGLCSLYYRRLCAPCLPHE
jgi:hypothetical protein